MKFNKPPLTHQEQLNLWKRRGLEVVDETKAIHYLTNISYYRLSAYALPFQSEKDKFDKGISFDDVLNLYLFDRELRLIVFDAIERLEVSIRTRMTYELAHKYGAHWQDNATIYKDPYRNSNKKTKAYFTVDIYSEIQDMIVKSTKGKHTETFIKHYKNTYKQPTNPPSWMCLEVLTLGQLSKLYNGLKNNEDKQLIASEFGVHHTVFKSWLHTLTHIRNICGHHGRLWNREIAIEPQWLQKPQLPWLTKDFEQVTNRSFYAISILKYLLLTVNPEHQLKEHLMELFHKYPKTPIKYMGIPSQGGNSPNLIDWTKQNLWTNSI